MRLEDCGGPQKRRESPCSVDASCRDKKKEVKEAKRTNSKTFQMSLECRHRVKFVTSSLNKAPLLKFWLSCCTEVKHGGAEVAVLTNYFVTNLIREMSTFGYETAPSISLSHFLSPNSRHRVSVPCQPVFSYPLQPAQPLAWDRVRTLSSELSFSEQLL